MWYRSCYCICQPALTTFLIALLIIKLRTGTIVSSTEQWGKTYEHLKSLQYTKVCRLLVSSNRCWVMVKKSSHNRFISDALLEFEWWKKAIAYVQPSLVTCTKKIAHIYSGVSAVYIMHYCATMWLRAHGCKHVVASIITIQANDIALSTHQYRPVSYLVPIPCLPF